MYCCLGGNVWYHEDTGRMSINQILNSGKYTLMEQDSNNAPHGKYPRMLGNLHFRFLLL